MRSKMLLTLTILGLAASAPSQAFLLLLAYAVGLGVPFLVIGLFAARASEWINRYAGKLRTGNIIFGIILVVLGILIFTGNLSRIANFEFLNRFLIG